MDFMHGGRMGERCTVLHAHNMKDWSMFMSIVSVEDPGYLAAHPAIEFIHEGTSYIARWFAGVLFEYSDPLPERTRFVDDADFEAWLTRVKSENRVPVDIPVPPDARLLVCSTCAFDKEPYDTYAAFAFIEKQVDPA